MANKVKGIKFGTWERYSAATKDPDTIYFITDKGGTVYRGTSLVIPANVIESVITNPQNPITGATSTVYRFLIEQFHTGGTAPDPIEFDVYNKEAVDAIRTVLENALSTHSVIDSTTEPITVANGKATNANYGHTKLTDTVDLVTPANNEAAASGGTAVTPKGVYDAIQATIGGIGGGIIFKGTLGTMADGGTVQTLPTTDYEAGWEYVVVTAGTYAGHVCEVGDKIMSVRDYDASTASNADWTVTQANIDGAVTASSDLTQNAVVLGNGSKTVKTIANGTAGQYLRIQNGVPTWVNHPNTDHGIAHCTCSSDANTNTKVATLTDSNASNFQLVSGALVAVYFTNLVSNKLGDVTLNVESTGDILVYFRGNKISEGIIQAGDTGTFMYDGTHWVLLTIDKEFSSVALSGNYDELIHKPIHVLVNSESASTTSRTVVDNSATSYPNRIFSVKFTNGIIFDTVATPTLAVTDDAATPNTIISAKSIMWHGAAISSGQILAGDTVTMIYNGTYFNVISVDRLYNETIQSYYDDNASREVYSHNLVTDKAVYDYVKQNALWWEELPAPTP